MSSETVAWDSWDDDPDEPDDEDDDDRCPMCGEDAVEKTPVPMGGGHTESWLICQMCGHVIEDDE